jgi:hypothetical protein
MDAHDYCKIPTSSRGFGEKRRKTSGCLSYSQRTSRHSCRENVLRQILLRRFDGLPSAVEP